MVETAWQLATAVKSYLQSLQDERVDSFLTLWPDGVGSTRPLIANSLPVHHYFTGVETAVSTQTAPLVEHLIAVADQLHWGANVHLHRFWRTFFDTLWLDRIIWPPWRAQT